MLIVVHFGDAPGGPPTTWASPCLSPLVYLPPPLISPSWATHIPLERGEADAAFLNVLCFYLSPHPSREGRGSFLGVCTWIEVAKAKVVVGGWVEVKQISTVIGLMWALNSTHPPRLCWIYTFCHSIRKKKLLLFYKYCEDVRSEFIRKNIQNWTCYLRNMLKW